MKDYQLSKSSFICASPYFPKISIASLVQVSKATRIS